ncbi:hypothetical protein AAFF_G00146890 [Aldrovandia affinis]|uniref:Uncharacterized protein n=1 Tax=Aldrovandia affinis TaxID=143900 RepID=A0AAD7RSA6_9TELE|nr:hypothetical protein AAFF_G00146890 [Aldrovandia affinis]
MKQLPGTGNTADALCVCGRRWDSTGEARGIRLFGNAAYRHWRKLSASHKLRRISALLLSGRCRLGLCAPSPLLTHSTLGPWPRNTLQRARQCAAVRSSLSCFQD